MSVLVEREAREAGRGPAGDGATGRVRPAKELPRPRRGEPRRPPTRARVVAGHRPRGAAPCPSCPPRTVAPRWHALVALAIAVCASLVGLGALTSGLAAEGGAPVPERTTVVPVAPGDTLREMAQRFAPDSDPGAVVDRMTELNDLSGAAITVGTPLVVPVQD